MTNNFNSTQKILITTLALLLTTGLATAEDTALELTGDLDLNDNNLQVEDAEGPVSLFNYESNNPFIGTGLVNTDSIEAGAVTAEEAQLSDQFEDSGDIEISTDAIGDDEADISLSAVSDSGDLASQDAGNALTLANGDVDVQEGQIALANLGTGTGNEDTIVTVDESGDVEYLETLANEDLENSDIGVSETNEFDVDTASLGEDLSLTLVTGDDIEVTGSGVQIDYANVDGLESDGISADAVGDSELANDETLNVDELSLTTALSNSEVEEDLTLSDSGDVDAEAVDLQSESGLVATTEEGLAIEFGDTTEYSSGVEVTEGELDFSGEDVNFQSVETDTVDGNAGNVVITYEDGSGNDELTVTTDSVDFAEDIDASGQTIEADEVDVDTIETNSVDADIERTGDGNPLVLSTTDSEDIQLNPDGDIDATDETLELGDLSGTDVVNSDQISADSVTEAEIDGSSGDEQVLVTNEDGSGASWIELSSEYLAADSVTTSELDGGDGAANEVLVTDGDEASYEELTENNINTDESLQGDASDLNVDWSDAEALSEADSGNLDAALNDLEDSDLDSPSEDDVAIFDESGNLDNVAEIDESHISTSAQFTGSDELEINSLSGDEIDSGTVDREYIDTAQTVAQDDSDDSSTSVDPAAKEILEVTDADGTKTIDLEEFGAEEEGEEVTIVRNGAEHDLTFESTDFIGSNEPADLAVDGDSATVVAVDSGSNEYAVVSEASPE